MQPWRLDELNYGQVKANPPFEVAVLPLGATEPHNLHLPYGTDTFQVEVIAARACALANQAGARVLLLPALALRHRDQPDEVSPGDELEPNDAGAGDHRSSRFAGGTRDPSLRPLERARGQRPEMGAARASSSNASTYLSLQLVSRLHPTSMRRSSRKRTTMPARWRRAWGWPISPIGRARAGGRWCGQAQPLRGGQSRLGRDHPPLAPPDHQLGRRRPSGRHGRQGRNAHHLVAERIGRFLTELA